MITNLKLGATADTMLLTDQDTDLNTKSQFTLPRLYSGNSSTTPYAFGPITGDASGEAGGPISNAAIASDTFYGYFYNWSAAIAGGSSSINTNGAVAPDSICPKGWRLPKGGPIGASTNEFDVLNAKMADFVDNQDVTYQSTYDAYYANWLDAGQFMGTLSGYWYPGLGFVSQTSIGLLWSSTSVSNLNAFDFSFSNSNVNNKPNGNYRNTGQAVRCVISL
jgi:uncharacterized protein (TIGR02145 family)